MAEQSKNAKNAMMLHVEKHRPFLEPSPHESDGMMPIGRHPDQITAQEWQSRPILIGNKAIRAKCLDCAGTAQEVSKCVCVDCPLWPIRMGRKPKAFRSGGKHG